MARILIIDDEKLTRFSIGHVLKSAGHEVTEAEDGNQGIVLQREQLFDLVVTDILSPEKDGIQTIKDLRSEYPFLPIIAISGGGRITSQEYLDDAKEFGADDVLAKPVTAYEILTCVEARLATE